MSNKLIIAIGALLGSFLLCLFVTGHERLGRGNSAPDQLNIVLPYEKRLLRASTPFGPGMDQELLDKFLAENGLEARYYYVRNYREALDLVRLGRCDLVVGFSGEPPEDQRFFLAESPVYASFYPVLVKTGGNAEHIYSNVLSGGLKNLPDEARREPVADRQPDKETLYLLNPHAYSILVPMYKNLHTQRWLTERVGYRWFWSAENAELGEKLEAFWQKLAGDTLEEMRERYFGFMPKRARPAELLNLSQVVSGKMEPYSAAIIKAADETGLDPFLIAAVIFQESRFDPEAVSFTGVRGIMQLTTDTANMLKVDRLDPEQCILGGARYLRSINDSLEKLDIPEWDRWCMVLAGYNQGPTTLRNAIRKAEAQGLPLNWASMRKIYPGLKQPNNPRFRPQEALSYVENVRYYYYVMSRLAAVAGDREEQDFAALRLLSAASGA
ncbi:MAG: transglycosylase SLT domain-containing protein [Deltaproteobacteria bacterium]|nr:transglycosylase SLT domain-containing protein [Deltaproteobacteria bacterium]